MNRILGLVSFALVGCATNQIASRAPASVAVDQTTRYFSSREKPFHLSRLNLAGARSPADLLARLPRQMRGNHLPLAQSGCLQGASVKSPRVVMASLTADLVVAVTGVDQPGGAMVLAREYNQVTERYDLHEYDFKTGVTHRVNDQRCTACHTEANAPLWGEDRGILTPVDDRRAFQSFVSDTRAPYDRLLRPKNEPLWPFAATPTDRWDFAPARRIGLGLRVHQGRSNAVALMRSRLYRDAPAHVIADLLRCPQRPTWRATLDEMTKTAGFAPSPNALWEIAGVVPYQSGLSALNRATGPTADEGLALGQAELDRPGEIEGAILWHDFKGRVSGTAEPEGPTPGFARRLGVPVAVLRQLGRIVPLYARDQIDAEICPALERAAARETKPLALELTAHQTEELRAYAGGRPYVLGQCVACHGAGGVEGAPALAFDHPDQTLLDKIKARTDRRASDQERMPKGAFALPAEEQARLLKYLSEAH